MTPPANQPLAGHPVLEFQPAVDLATGRLLGFEALLRWRHPTHGLVSPAVIIPWAEANGDIIELNAWVLAEACHQAHQWPSGIQLAVNCSIVQLRQGEASLSVARALERSGLNPDRLTVEITEHTIADERAAADLRALSALGVHLAVDDVGTMWSSLNSLRRFAVDTVKIDAAFIANLESDEGMNRAIVDAIVHVGQSLNMSTVAEGVETAAQAAILREFGADVAQGYFFARPMSAEDTMALALAEPRTVFSLTESSVSDRGQPNATSAHPRELVTAGTPSGRSPAAVAAPGGDPAEPAGRRPPASDTGAVAGVGSGESSLDFALDFDFDLAYPLPGPGVYLALEPSCWPPAGEGSTAEPAAP